MKKTLFLFIVLLFAIAPAFGIDPIQKVGFSRHPLTVGAARELANSLKRARDSYVAALQLARREAVRLNKEEDTARIDRAIAGESVSSFSTPMARDAYKAFHGRLLDANRLLMANLSSARNNAKLQNDYANALYLESLSTEMGKYLEMAGDGSSSMRRSFKVFAGKDYQSTGLVVAEGSQITANVVGSWAPGSASRKNSIRSADADTYPVAVQIADQSVKCQKNRIFTVTKGGTIYLRMASPAYSPRYLSAARGSVQITMEIHAPARGAEANTIERALAELTTQTAAPAEAGGVYTAKISAAQDWQKTGVTLKAKQKVIIEADGVWTSDTGNKRLLYRDADALGYSVKVGNTYHGPGGNQMIFIARNKGELEVKPRFFDHCKKKGLQPGGELTLKIKVVNP